MLLYLYYIYYEGLQMLICFATLCWTRMNKFSGLEINLVIRAGASAQKKTFAHTCKKATTQRRVKPSCLNRDTDLHVTHKGWYESKAWRFKERHRNITPDTPDFKQSPGLSLDKSDSTAFVHMCYWSQHKMEVHQRGVKGKKTLFDGGHWFVTIGKTGLQNQTPGIAHVG